MVVTSSKRYLVSAKYCLEIETEVDGIKFENDYSTDSVEEAYKQAKEWSTPHTSLFISRTIYFKKQDNSLADNKPIIESLTLRQLEKFVLDGENLPEKTYQAVAHF